MVMHRKTLLILILSAMLASCAKAPIVCTPPVAGNDWQVASPESVGLSSTTLCAMLPALANWKGANVHAVLVLRHGKLVFEHYFQGRDERFGRSQGEVTFGPDVRHDERSVTKSVTSLLIGIAIDQGWIKSVDESVLSFFPEYADLRTPEKGRITIRDLLTMSAGLEWHEFDVPYTSEDNSENEMDSSKDPYRYVLSQPVEVPPGKIWNYNSGATELLGAILKKASGKPLDELARTLIFNPLGITDFEWNKYDSGAPMAASGLRLRPRDLAKIGQLVLQRGAWNGRQLISQSWIDASITPQINGNMIFFYGYQFWLGRSFVQKQEVDWAAGWGLGGQRVFIVPKLDMVIVVNSGMYRSDLQAAVPLVILNHFVMQSLKTQ